LQLLCAGASSHFVLVLLVLLFPRFLAVAAAVAAAAAAAVGSRFGQRCVRTFLPSPALPSSPLKKCCREKGYCLAPLTAPARRQAPYQAPTNKAVEGESRGATTRKLQEACYVVQHLSLPPPLYCCCYCCCYCYYCCCHHHHFVLHCFLFCTSTASASAAALQLQLLPLAASLFLLPPPPATATYCCYRSNNNCCYCPTASTSTFSVSVPVTTTVNDLRTSSTENFKTVTFTVPPESVDSPPCGHGKRWLVLTAAVVGG